MAGASSSRRSLSAMMGMRNHQLLGAFNGQLALTVFILMISSFNFGMDNSAFAATQAMPSFDKKFGVWSEEQQDYAIEPYFLSLFNSLTYVGQVTGVIFGGWISRRYGRRWSFYTMCFWALLSAVLLVTGQRKEQMLVGRIINYIYIGQQLVTVPVMQAEICPAHVRGFAVATYQFGNMLGAFIGSLICYGTSTLEGDKAYRIPFGIFFIIPCIVLVGVYFSPESPRWLLVRHRQEDALESLRKYRKGRFTEEEIRLEFQTLVALVSQTHERGKFRELWQGTNRKRSLISIGANFFAEMTGQAFAAKYGAVFIKDLKALNPFAMQCIMTAIFIVVVMAAMSLIDKIGRRPVLLTGTFLQASSFLVMGGLGTRAKLSHSYEVGISAMLTINYSGFCFGWGPLYHLITSEIPSNHMRDLTFACASIVNVIVQFVVTFTIPYLLYKPYADLGPKLGFIYGSLAACALVFAFFCIPECRRFSLEEIDYLFVRKAPILKFGKQKHGEILPEGVMEIVAEKLEVGVSVEQREFVQREENASGRRKGNL